MAKDGTNRGGARIGAGAKKKPLADKIAEGNPGKRALTVISFDDRAAELEGQAMPKPSKMLSAVQKDGKALVAEDIYKETWEWLAERGCASLVSPQLLERYAMSVARWIQCEEAVTEFGFLAKHAQKVWGFVSSSKPLLQRYMESHGHNCTDEELDGIYKSLKTVNYNSPAADFDARIDAQLNKVAYNRNKVRIQELWKEQSGFDSITLWCANYAVPIQWVVSDEVLPHIIVLKTVQDGKIADNTALHNATQFFETHTVSALKDKAYIASCFISQIGESYRSAFESSGPVLVSRLKTNTKLTSDVYSWANKVGEIRKTVDAFLRDKFCGEAKKKVKSMPEAQLRDKVVQLLDENPDLYTLFIK